MAETKFRLKFYNYSYRDFNVTLNGVSKCIERYNNEAFYSDEKEEKTLIIQSYSHGAELYFEYKVMSHLNYTFDSSFNLIQNNNEKLLRESKMNKTDEELIEIINQGNQGNKKSKLN